MEKVRINPLTLVGIVLVLSGLSFWILSWLDTLGFGSADTDLDVALRGWMVSLSGLSIVLTFLVFFTPLAALGQIPGVAYVQLYWWHYGYPSSESIQIYRVMALLYLLVVVGVVTCVVSMFIEIHPRHPKGVRWTRRNFEMSTFQLVDKDTPGGFLLRSPAREMRLSPKLKMAIPVVILLVSVAITGYALNAMLTTEVSTIEVEFVVSIKAFGPVVVALYIDEVKVNQTYLETTDNNYSTMATWITENKVSAGSHLLGIDVSNATGGGPDGTMEVTRVVRVLPFTTEQERLGLPLPYGGERVTFANLDNSII